jgi:hypothetical protein
MAATPNFEMRASVRAPFPAPSNNQPGGLGRTAIDVTANGENDPGAWWKTAHHIA